jgi:hypothetical protein
MIRFIDGLATRNRLPLDHVIRVLNEIKSTLETIGKDVQREQGAEDPSGDFGLEIVGGFRRGSVKAAVAITKNQAAGVVAARQFLSTVNSLSTQFAGRKRSAKSATVAAVAYDPRVVSRVGNINKVREIDKTRVEFSLVQRGGGRQEKATINDRTAEVLAKLREPNFAIEDLTVYGKLSQLRDPSGEGEESRKAFFGELVGDDGQTWRIEFRPDDAQRVAGLFRRQVHVTGNAVYYKALNPKIVAKDFGPDEQRDYDAAFDEMFGASPELTDTPLKKLIEELETD